VPRVLGGVGYTPLVDDQVRARQVVK
jgi:hypothetical protein